MSATSSPPPTPRKASIPRPPPSPLRPSSPAASDPHHRRALPAFQCDTALPAAHTLVASPDKKHYGLGVGPPPALPGKTQDPMNLDSPAFDPKTYYEQLITTVLAPCAAETRERASHRWVPCVLQIRELDSEPDTIAAMKTRAESLDADLDLLRIAFSEISRLSTEVSNEDGP
ncbi:hypothetical protein FB451DRAFT_1397356 [Mycena latifolia]|nr:hypothetical protein FB451DRAFT_1397356 [Mycena latifolia]